MAKVYISLPLDESSKLILEALNNETSRRILEALSDEPLSISQLSSRLSAPITTIQYNVDKLLKAGLIKVSFKRFSEKRRVVEYYEPEDKLIVIVPKKPKNLLKESLFVLSALLLSVLMGLAYQTSVPQVAMKGLERTAYLPAQAAWPWFLAVGVAIVALSYIWRRLLP